jgi:hypothetical protein
MNSNDDKQKQLSFFPPKDPRGVPESKSGAADGGTAEQLIDAAKNAGGPANEGENFEKAANSRQFPTIDQTPSENATTDADNSRQFPTSAPTIPDNSRQFPTGQSPTDDDQSPADAARRHVVHPNYRRGRERMMWELAHDATLIEAAERAGLSERTAQRYWADNNFKNQVLDLRCQFYWKTTGQLAMTLDQATQTLTEALKSKSERIRIAAAQALFRFAREMGSTQQQNMLLEQKLDAIMKEGCPPQEDIPE